jgi:hypothetical protein
MSLLSGMPAAVRDVTICRLWNLTAINVVKPLPLDRLVVVLSKGTQYRQLSSAYSSLRNLNFSDYKKTVESRIKMLYFH